MLLLHHEQATHLCVCECWLTENIAARAAPLSLRNRLNAETSCTLLQYVPFYEQSIRGEPLQLAFRMRQHLETQGSNTPGS